MLSFDELRTELDRKLAESSSSLKDLSSNAEAQMIGSVVESALQRYRNMITLRAIAIAAGGPTALLAFMGAIPPVAAVMAGVFTGTIASGLSFPLQYRLQAAIKRWASAAASDRVGDTTPFLSQMTSAGIATNAKVKDQARDGRNSRNDAMQQLSRDIEDCVLSEEDDISAAIGLAYALLDVRLCYPEVPIDDHWAELVHFSLGERLQNESTFQIARTVLEQEAGPAKVPFTDLEARLQKLVKPELFRPSEIEAPKEVEATYTPDASLSKEEDGARKAIVDRGLDAAIAKLDVPAKWYVTYYRPWFAEQIRGSFDARLSADGVRAKDLAEGAADALAYPSIDATLARYKSWLSVKGGAISVIGPVAISFLLNMLPKEISIFASVVGGGIAGSMMFPLSYRLSALIKRWTTSDAGTVRENTPFSREMDQIAHARNALVTDPSSDGRFIRRAAKIQLSLNLRRVFATKNDDDAARAIAAAILDLRQAFPELGIDRLWSNMLFLRLEKRFANAHAYPAIEKQLEEAAPKAEIPVEELKERLDAMLRPDLWRT
jgi:hypothetical protein